MPQIASISVERRPSIYNDQIKINDNKVSQFPRIILEGLTPVDKEQAIKGWKAKCKSERIQGLKPAACGVAATLLVGAAFSLVLHFFILNAVTSLFTIAGSRWGRVLYRFIPITPLANLGFGGGLGFIGLGAYTIFNKFIRPYFNEAIYHEKKARWIEKELVAAQNPKIEATQQAPQQAIVQEIATKVLSKKELDRNRFNDYAKAIALAATVVLVFVSSAVGLYFASQGLLYLLTLCRYFPAAGGLFHFCRDIGTDIASVVICVEIMALTAVLMRHMKNIVSKFIEKAQEHWNKAADYDRIASLKMRKEEFEGMTDKEARAGYIAFKEKIDAMRHELIG